jgi:hypothetical protein
VDSSRNFDPTDSTDSRFPIPDSATHADFTDHADSASHADFTDHADSVRLVEIADAPGRKRLARAEFEPKLPTAAWRPIAIFVATGRALAIDPRDKAGASTRLPL